jgi:hypothetical protein
MMQRLMAVEGQEEQRVSRLGRKEGRYIGRGKQSNMFSLGIPACMILVCLFR